MHGAAPCKIAALLRGFWLLRGQKEPTKSPRRGKNPLRTQPSLETLQEGLQKTLLVPSLPSFCLGGGSPKQTAPPKNLCLDPGFLYLLPNPPKPREGFQNFLQSLSKVKIPAQKLAKPRPRPSPSSHRVKDPQKIHLGWSGGILALGRGARRQPHSGSRGVFLSMSQKSPSFPLKIWATHVSWR